MQLVVVMAVRKAVSAATTTFTAISMKRFFMALYSSLFTLHSSLFTRAALVFVETFATIAALRAEACPGIAKLPV